MSTALAAAAPAQPIAAIVRGFTPNWFAATMGTGITALMLNQFPFAHIALYAAGTALWLLNIALFAAFTALYAARWLRHPREAAEMLAHGVLSMFLGCIPMGLATIVNGFLAFGPDLIGPAATGLALALWWIDVALSLAVGLLVPFLMFTRQDHAMERMTAVWLLPLVAAEVAAASGAQLAPHLADPRMAFPILMLGYMLWAFSVPLAFGLLAVLLLRLILHKLPPAEMGASMWLALGPIATGALGLLLLGAGAPAAFAAAGLPALGPVAQGIGVVGGAILWGYGTWWAALATLATIRYLHGGMRFNLGWWAFTFPIGVYTAATYALAAQTHLAFLAFASSFLTVVLAGLWLLVATRTAAGALDGTLFPRF